MRTTARLFKPSIISLATAYDDQSGPSELVIPESLEGMEYAALVSLREQAVETFNTILEGVEGTMSAEENATLASLTDGIEALSAEIATQDSANAERLETASALAARVAAASGVQAEDEEEGDGTPDGSAAEEEDEENEGGDAEAEAEGEPLVAGGGQRSEFRLPLSSVKRKTPQAPLTPPALGMKSIAFASGDAGTGYAAGTGVDFEDIGKAIDRKLSSHNSGQYLNAHKAKRHLREQHGIATFSRNFPAEAMIETTDRDAVDKAIAFAVDESRLPSGGLIASGTGWCAPSETMYDLLELETRAGMLSIPEVGINRGGLQMTPGPDFSTIYQQFPGFHFTEQDDIDGKYQPGSGDNVVGPKPSVKIECPEFTDHRLEASGLSIQAGLLMSRGYPEVIARTVRGALVAHEHRMNAELIQRMVAGSTAVALPARNAGAVGPLLEAIELQATHYRYVHRLAENATLEAVFPLWLRGAMRADLARRDGLEVFEVSDQRLNNWLTSRQIAPQFVYNWQAIDGTGAAAFTSWPTEASFLLYAAGTWLRGASPLITLDTIYDSTLVHQNDFTALFTEEGWLVAKRGFDSRAVTVPLCYDGGVAAAIALECTGIRAEVSEG